MTHLHKASGQTFEVGELRDGYKTYDIQVISYWKDAETQGVGSPVEIIGYYFGDYDKDTTDLYIDKWLANREKEISVLQEARQLFDTRLLIDKDFLDYPTIQRLEQARTECCELLENRSWRFETKHCKEWYEAEEIKKVLTDCAADPGDTSIKITIERDGKTVTADLYDHAALVTSLYESLDYFQSEL